MNRELILRHKIWVSIIFSALLFLLTQLVFGFHYGWLDDVIQTNYIRGIGISEPLSHHFTAHVLLLNAYRVLYINFPDIAWYGFFFIFYIYLATVNATYFFLLKVEQLNDRRWKCALYVGLLFFISVWFDQVYLLNYTQISILLVGTSLLLLVEILNRQKLSINVSLGALYLSICMMIGLLTRPDVMILVIGPFSFYLVVRLKGHKQPIKTIITCLAVGVIFIGICRFQIDSNFNKINKTISHIINLTDLRNTFKPFNILLEEDIRYKAIFLYYWPDEELISDQQLQKWGPQQSLKSLSLKHLKENFFIEWKRAARTYQQEYCPGLNWMPPLICLIILSLSLIAVRYFYAKETKSQLLYSDFLLLFLVVFMLVLVMALAKMEARIAMPLISLVTLSILGNTVKSSSHFFYTRTGFSMLVLITVFCFVRVQQNYRTASDKKQECLKKEAFVEELNAQFSDKLILFDIWTLSLLHASPLKNIQLNPRNTYLTYFESWSNFLDCQQAYWKQKCGKASFQRVYSCLYAQKEDVVFVHTLNLRIGLIEEYGRKVHQTHLTFKETHLGTALSELHYSFLPYHYDFGYYQIDTLVKINP